MCELFGVTSHGKLELNELLLEFKNMSGSFQPIDNIYHV